MTAFPSLRAARVAIIGVGLMGGSLAMALRGHCAALYGADPDQNTQVLARERGVVDVMVANPASLPPADLLILAAPVRAILTLIATLPTWHPTPAMVLDLGSTKTAVAQAMAALPPHYEPLGGHPMCGKEVGTLAHADPLIFRDATFAFTPLACTTARARQIAEELATAVAAQPLWLDAETHDCWVAATSHAPYLIANALVAATPAEAAPLIGPGFRSTTRIAATPPAMMLDVLLTNRQHVLAALAQFRTRLEALEADLVAFDEAGLQEKLQS